MSDVDSKSKPTLKERRRELARVHVLPALASIFAATVLGAVGVISTVNVDDVMDNVDRSGVQYDGSYKYSNNVEEHNVSSGSLMVLSSISFIGAFGFAAYAGSRVVRASNHINGNNDRYYNPNSYDA